MRSKIFYKIFWKSRSLGDVQRNSIVRFLIGVCSKYNSEVEILPNSEGEFFQLWHYTNNILLIILFSLIFYKVVKY